MTLTFTTENGIRDPYMQLRNATYHLGHTGHTGLWACLDNFRLSDLINAPTEARLQAVSGDYLRMAAEVLGGLAEVSHEDASRNAFILNEFPHELTEEQRDEAGVLWGKQLSHNLWVYFGTSTALGGRSVSRIDGTWAEAGSGGLPEGVELIPLSSWGSSFARLAPTAEHLAGLPESIRSSVGRIVPAQAGGGSLVLNKNDDGQHSLAIVTGPQYGNVTVESLIAEAREAWRLSLRARMNNSERNEAEIAERARHRDRTRTNFINFAQREAETEQHVATLPFVPHGLASSRRWGIEVETGGARGASTPAGWNRHGDGSLRSAYDGYVEVQDFEPYDEERAINRSWLNCENAGNHNPRREEYDSRMEQYVYTLNPDFIDPRECSQCGPLVMTVRVEPQTITHYAQAGDCQEFVSPILTSMHSNGLEELCAVLSKNPQNDSSGIHVHVESDDLSKKQIATLVYGYDILEPILEASYRRNRRNYCQRRPADVVLDAVRKGDEFEPGNQERYVTLNTLALSQHGTLEFRAMGPVYEYEYLVRWAMLCRELVNVVANGATSKDFAQVKSWQDLLNLLTRFGKEYIRASVYEMTGEVGEAKKLEKEGKAVTTEALNADLDSMMDNIAASVRRFQLTMENLSARLVGAGSTSET